MHRQNWYLSTVDPNAAALARRDGLGVEIAEFCTAWNMDDHFPEVDAHLRRSLQGIHRRILHGPFNELFPCAIDPKAQELAAFRFRQALALAEHYGARKLILHGGFIPRVYYPCWYRDRSVEFWHSFLSEYDGTMTICLENVLEDAPDTLMEIAEGVNDLRLQLCLDVGHANVYSDIPPEAWINAWGTRLNHMHVHNNDGTQDTHSGPEEGSLDLARILRTAEAVNPEITCTFELPNAENAAAWLIKKELLSQ